MIFQKKSIFIASILIVTVLLSGPFLFVHPVKALDPPIHIHLTWQHETNTTITVTWQTSTNTAGDTVKYDTVSRGGVPGDYSYSATGINHTYTGASGYIHDVELTGLAPNTTYYFICGGDTGGWSNERAFRTAPSVPIDPLMGTYVRFVMGGDSRTNVAEREKISKAMAKFNPAFVMHDGDMVYDGDKQDLWDAWFTDLHDHWICNNSELDNYGLTIPLIPAEGNHEEDSPKYYEQLALPGNEMYYSYDWGPDIHIIVLDSEKEETALDDAEHQAAWLESDLINHSSAMWKIAIFHRPPFVTGNHDPWQPARTWWVPLFDKYHVDLVVCGHEHSYQRTYPINWTASQTEPQDYSNGTLYIVSGGWGAPLYNPQTAWWQAYANKIYHFCLVEINGTSLHLQAKDNLGNTFDEITIEKGPPIGVRASFSYTPQRNLPYVDERVTFDASDSDAGNGTHYFPIENYTWNFDDSTPPVTETDPITTHNYTAPGEYTVTLNVTALNTTDNSLIWDTESKTIKVYVPSHNITINSVIDFDSTHGQKGTNWGGPGGGPPLTPVKWAHQTWDLEIRVTIQNRGTFPESFNVKVFYGNSTGNFTTGIAPAYYTATLGPQVTTTVTFTWNVPKTNTQKTYTIFANFTWLPEETKIMRGNDITVMLVGDTDADVDCDLDDLINFGALWTCMTLADPGYWPWADFDNTGFAELSDLIDFGTAWVWGPFPAT